MNERAHHCHATGCRTSCKPEFLMCYSHWRCVPARLQNAVYRTYRPGQCDDMQPSKEWHLAADAAIGYVARLENLPLTAAQLRAVKLSGVSDPRAGDLKTEPLW